MSMRSVTIECPQCGRRATVALEVIPTMGDAGLTATGYACGGGCRYEDSVAAIDARAGVSRDLG